MISHVIIAVFLLYVPSPARPALFFEKQHEVPDHPGQCVADDGSFLPVGESACGTKVCSRLTCLKHETSSQMLLQTATCGTMSIMPPCHLSTETTSKCYPDCCPKVICPTASKRRRRRLKRSRIGPAFGTLRERGSHYMTPL